MAPWETGGGDWGRGLGAEDFHYGLILQSLWLQSDPKYHWEQQCEGLEAPGGKGLGAAWQLLKLSQRRKLLLPPGELGDAARVFPLQSPQPLLTFESPRRRKQSSWGWEGECRASVTVRAHCRGPFSFPLGRLRFRVFLLLEEMGGEMGSYQPGQLLVPTPPAPSAPFPPVHWLGSHRSTAGA
uniref:Uncharacterized protein n=1 Tax=Piliocolobus tephrosceles TaxID=591936 RepID=A0A8C9LZG6_9PRIM